MSNYDWQWVEENPQTALEIINDLERENAELREQLREIKRICFGVAEVYGPTEGEPNALLLNGGVPAVLLARARAKEAKP